MIRRFLILAVLTSLLSVSTVFTTSQPSSAQACEWANGSVDCYGWEFDYELAGSSVIPTGLTMYDVFHNGDSMLYQAHFAALPVKYTNNQCGPYIDLFSTVTNSDPQGVQVGTFVDNGVDWLEMGAHFQIGSYVLYNAFYFSELGEMKMRMFARGLQCNQDHVHWPMMVVDVDVEGPTTVGNDGTPQHGVGDEIFYFDGTDWQPQTVESDNEVAAFGHEWIVRDSVSKKTVAVNYDSGIFTPPSRDTYEPAAAVNNKIYTRQSNGFQDLTWAGATPGEDFLSGNSAFNNAEWSYNDGQTITDPVVVVRGYLDHDYGFFLPDDWHTSGISVRFIDDPLAAPVQMGDVNCDERSSVVDALFIAQYAVGNRTASTCPLGDPTAQMNAEAADVSGDGRVSVQDALFIAQCAVGLPNSFCPDGG